MFKQLAPYITPVIVVAVLAWRMSRQASGRPLKPSRLWIRPAVLAVLLAMSFVHPPALTPLGLAAIAVAVAAGIGLGYLLASHQALAIDPVTGKITSKMSPVGIALFIGLFAARYAFRLLIQGGQAPDKLMVHSAQITLWTDVGLFFLVALVGAQAWELWRRSRPLLAEHAARRAESSAGQAG